MTRAQLLKQVDAMMRDTTFGVDQFLMRIREDKNYKYEKTKMYALMKRLEQAKLSDAMLASLDPITGQRPTPKPANDDYLNVVRRCLFLTDDISHALDTRSRLLIATADLAYRHNYTPEFIKAAIVRGVFRVWCDCRPAPDGTPPEVALKWLDDLGLPHTYFYGQCETEYEFDAAYAAGCRTMVGKVPNLRPDQRDKIKSKEVLVTNETYYNVELQHNASFAANWCNVNEGVGSNTVATYESDTEGAKYYSLMDQAHDNRYNPDQDCLYVADFRGSDWSIVIAY